MRRKRARTSRFFYFIFFFPFLLFVNFLLISSFALNNLPHPLSRKKKEAIYPLARQTAPPCELLMLSTFCISFLFSFTWWSLRAYISIALPLFSVVSPTITAVSPLFPPRKSFRLSGELETNKSSRTTTPPPLYIPLLHGMSLHVTQ